MTATSEALAPYVPPADGCEEVIPSISFEALLVRRSDAVAQLTAIDDAVKAYGKIGETICVSRPSKFLEPINQTSGRGKSLTGRDWLKHATACVDAALWQHLLVESGLWSFFDAEARKEWYEQIEKNATTPLTAENVAATFRELYGRRGEFFERGIIRVFLNLSWDYKTNRPCKFGKRVILRDILDRWGFPNHRQADSLDDLERAFHLLDGRPEPDHRQGVNSRLYSREKGADLVDDYLRIRTFKNGNGHVTFLRQDLVDQLNRILVRHYPDAFPPASVAYPEPPTGRAPPRWGRRAGDVRGDAPLLNIGGRA